MASSIAPLPKSLHLPLQGYSEGTALLLAKRIQGVLVTILWDPNGAVVASVTEWGVTKKVRLNGLPSHLSPAHVSKAYQLLRTCQLRWDGNTLKVELKLKGGGCCQSTEKGEKDPLLPPPSEPKRRMENPVSSYRVTAPFPDHWSMPSQNPLFTGRENLLLEMSKQFKEWQPDHLNQVVLSGLGGVGKSSLATEYAYRNRTRYSLVWWISEEYPLKNFWELGEALGLVEPGDKPQKVLAAVLGWLNQQEGWLLIFDNFQNIGQLKNYLPTRGDVLITSRNPHWKGSLEVGTFSVTESVDLLNKVTKQVAEASAEELAAALGFLPLALTQAASYMRETQTSYAKYLEIFTEQRTELWGDEKAPRDYPETVAKTWKISVDQIRNDLPDALKLLYCAAFLAPSDIPDILLGTGGQEIIHRFHDPFFDDYKNVYSRAEGEKGLAFHQQLHKLQQFSLFVPGQKEHTYSVHRLVQAVTRDQLSEERRKEILVELVWLFRDHWNFTILSAETFSESTSLSLHGEVLCQYAEKTQEVREPIALILTGLGNFYANVEVDLLRSIDLYLKSYHLGKRVWGVIHKRIATCLLNLGATYLQLADKDQAIKYYSQAIAVLRKIPAEDQPYQLASILSVLGNIYIDKFDLINARKYHLAAIDEWLRWGKGDMSDNYKSLLMICRMQGDEKNVLIYQEKLGLLQGRSQQGNELLSSMQDQEIRNIERWLPTLAYIHDDEGHHEIAEKLVQLGFIRVQRKEFDKAIESFEKALTINKKCYGDQHPKVARCYRGLGVALRGQKKLSGSIEYLQKSLAIKEKLLGKNHPGVEECLFELGLTYLDQKKFQEASTCFEKSVSMALVINGDKHPMTGIRYQHLGLCLMAKGDRAKAKEPLTKALAILRTAVPEEHPLLIEIKESLAQAR